MKNRRAVVAIETLLAFVTLFALGFAGYNFAKTGCPLGHCGPCQAAPAAK